MLFAIWDKKNKNMQIPQDDEVVVKWLWGSHQDHMFFPLLL